jgi:hypothetical protein
MLPVRLPASEGAGRLLCLRVHQRAVQRLVPEAVEHRQRGDGRETTVDR